MNIQNTKTQLNGVGVRKKYFLNIYIGGLYLLNKSNNAKKVIEADEAMGIKIHIVSKFIFSKKMINGVEKGFEKSTNGNQDKFRSKINKLLSFFEDEINKEDVFDIVYHPNTGTTVYKNNLIQGNIKSLDFKQALFGVWLCDDPADEDLKEMMLNL